MDIEDLARLMRYCTPGKPELDFDHDQELQRALSSLLQERPRLRSGLRRILKCREIFRNW